MKELLLIGMFIVSIVLFGLSYATVIKFVSDDIYNKFKDNITNIFIIDSVLIFLLIFLNQNYFVLKLKKKLTKHYVKI